MACRMHCVEPTPELMLTHTIETEHEWNWIKIQDFIYTSRNIVFMVSVILFRFLCVVAFIERLTYNTKRSRKSKIWVNPISFL